MLRSNVPLLRRSVTEHFVFPRMLMSSPSASVRVQDPRIKTEVLLLDSSHEKLWEFDRTRRDDGSISKFRRQICNSLVALHNRPKIPRQIGEYEVVESLDTTDTTRLLRAVHEDGTARFLRLIRRPTTMDPRSTPEECPFAQYQTLKRLGAQQCSPGVDPYFSWEERTFWVIPIHPTDGRTLRADRSAAFRDSGRFVKPPNRHSEHCLGFIQRIFFIAV